MKNNQSPVLFASNGKVWTTSLDIGARFGKRHDNVLQAIQNLECSTEFARLNFQASEYTDSTGRTLPCVQMT